MSFQMDSTYKIQNQNSLTDLEPASQESRGPKSASPPPMPRTPETAFPLGMALNSCPDIADYAKTGIANWRDFLATTAVIRPMLGISPSAWLEAQEVMGEAHAAIVVAAILQRGATIASPGGYLRDLTEKARQGKFSPGPMLMALIGNRKRSVNEKMTA